MYDIIRILRAGVIIAFIFYLLWKFAQYLLLPLIIFIIIMKLLSFVKIKPKKTNKNKSENQNDDQFIDGEYEDLD